ncbi:hypothetical protein MRX96_044477 [Rhipicephalus microplus]
MSVGAVHWEDSAIRRKLYTITPFRILPLVISSSSVGMVGHWSVSTVPFHCVLERPSLLSLTLRTSLLLYASAAQRSSSLSILIGHRISTGLSFLSRLFFLTTGLHGKMTDWRESWKPAKLVVRQH